MKIFKLLFKADQKQQWQEQQAMYINLRYPDDHGKKRKRRKRIRQKANEESKSNNAENRPGELNNRILKISKIHFFCIFEETNEHKFNNFL